MYFPALLYTCILSMLLLIDGIPIHLDVLKSLVKWQADIIIQRIEKHNEKLNLPPHLFFEDLYPEVPANKPIQGVGSIMDTLTTFQRILQKLPEGHVSPLHRDVSTLLGYLKRRMTTMHCTSKELANWMSLDAFLKENATHHITVGYITLDRLKQFMQKLIGNIDQLKSC
ncbi:leptin a [Pseudorasbora parva]|uniref:leptin a n=1 Tax=Pseudorasbora parva TaxID=51549 RepID=UPI00351E1FAC